jgi:aspartyl-tRNA(Asn)/glutamyl-tRNA(Gln) amidotransferase subunit B
MEKGNLRADVNVSVRKPGGPLGTRCEIKNMNSISFIGDAIEYEARRQVEIIEDGGTIDQETRLYDPGKGETRSMRSKEEAHDYRYFPDPDLLPLEFTQAFVDELKANLPELPDQKRAKYVRDYGLTPYDAAVLVAHPDVATFYEVVAEHEPANAKMAANWIINEVFGRLNKEGLEIKQSRVKEWQLGALLMAIGAETISTNSAKKVFDVMWKEGGDPGEVIERLGLRQVTDRSQVQIEIDVLVLKNPDKAEQAKAKPQILGWFVGQVMKRLGGKANPQLVSDMLKEKLGI